LEVHRDYRRVGVGRALVSKAVEIAEERGCDTVAVWSAKEAVEFYKKCGISEIAYSVVHAEVDLDEVSAETRERYSVTPFPDNYDTVKSMEFVSSRTFSSFAAWIKSRWSYAVEKNKVLRFECCIPELKACYVVKSFWNDKHTANLLLWVNDAANVEQTLNEVFGIARKNGIARLHLLIDESIYRRIAKKYPHRVLDREILLAKRVRYHII